jgi:hypothetical protein
MEVNMEPVIVEADEEEKKTGRGAHFQVVVRKEIADVSRFYLAYW